MNDSKEFIDNYKYNTKKILEIIKKNRTTERTTESKKLANEKEE